MATVGMYRLRSQQNGCRLLKAFGASKRIVETIFDTH
jgi:hypothetical protein